MVTVNYCGKSVVGQEQDLLIVMEKCACIYQEDLNFLGTHKNARNIAKNKGEQKKCQNKWKTINNQGSWKIKS
jgi:hypothetical protein